MICQDPQALLEMMQKIFAQEKQTANFRCDSQGDRAHEVSKRAIEKIKKECPDLPWNQILVIADELAYSDMAIQYGTTCQDYIFEVRNTMISHSAKTAVGECKGVADLSLCIEDVLCPTVGKYSTICQ